LENSCQSTFELLVVQFIKLLIYCFDADISYRFEPYGIQMVQLTPWETLASSP